MAALKDADPGFLEKIFGALLVCGDVNEIAEQAILIKLDEVIEQVGIAALQAASDVLGARGHQVGKEQGRPQQRSGSCEAGGCQGGREAT